MSLTIWAGDDRLYTAAVYLNDMPLSLVGMIGATFLVKANVQEADSAALITKTLAAGDIVVTDPAGGILTIQFDAADTVAMQDATLSCALKIKNAAGLTYTVYAGGFSVVRPAVLTT
jgi:hypothetical protein